ncbi:MAG: hypothetical protein JWR86_259 [Enterovirga sp.]|nr:hypothetical protein [Enterovirga sp.]
MTVAEKQNEEILKLRPEVDALKLKVKSLRVNAGYSEHAA